MNAVGSSDPDNSLMRMNAVGSSDPDNSLMRMDVVGSSDPDNSLMRMDVVGSSDPDNSLMRMDVVGSSDPDNSLMRMDVVGSSDPDNSLKRMDETGSSDPDNSQGHSLISDLTESECDLFRNLKLLDQDQEWSDEGMVLLSRTSGSSSQALSSIVGLCDPMAQYLNEEFKAFLEKRGTYKELERVVSKVLLKLLQARKADESPLFISPKPDNSALHDQKKTSTLDKETNVSRLNGTAAGPSAVDASPSPTPKYVVISLVDGLDLDPSTNQCTGNTKEIPEEQSSSILRMEQQECLNKIAFNTHAGVKAEYINPELVNKKKLGQSPRHRYTGRLPPVSSGSRGSDITSTSLRGILQAALSSLNRQIRREIYLSQKLGMIVIPLSGTR
ncbi:uncharacterized protein LOC121587299 [Coregonus clupeaformis]|uniref:uncharacterized protein LOC121587299 n=1 Tax=Coregonus clupeaformis TaxID=59861 RepID=UPI001BDFC4A1|nr:uncharacterized protein LOC121587299 [Coregonus clupeaformis]